MAKSKKKGGSGKSKPLPAQGAAGGSKRTPLHHMDGAAGRERYEVEAIVDRALNFSVLKYNVKWKDCDKVPPLCQLHPPCILTVGLQTSNIWEPIGNLVGAEALVAD